MYRLGEAQLVKVATPFLVDSRNSGGIGLTSAQYGIAYGTLGMICLTIGGILGGVVASKFGLKKMIWIMALAMNIPISVYVYLSTFQPVPGDITIYLAIATEQMDMVLDLRHICFICCRSLEKATSKLQSLPLELHLWH